jgi:hypothetical protein
MAYSGKYRPISPQKYRGNPTEIYYRSLWELRFMKWCDENKKVLEWGSEEIVVPYRSPLDGKYHRYFVDFYIKVESAAGIKKYLIEIKPKKQTIEPKVQQRKTKKYIQEVTTYVKNFAKWEAAREYCADRRMEFLILTEEELFGVR